MSSWLQWAVETSVRAVEATAPDSALGFMVFIALFALTMWAVSAPLLDQEYPGWEFELPVFVDEREVGDE